MSSAYSFPGKEYGHKVTHTEKPLKIKQEETNEGMKMGTTRIGQNILHQTNKPEKKKEKQNIGLHTDIYTYL